MLFSETGSTLTCVGASQSGNLPFVKVGGVFLAYKGRGADAEIAEAKNAVAVLGGEVERVERADIGDAERALVVRRKTKPTPEAYPRAFARIKKKPL